MEDKMTKKKPSMFSNLILQAKLAYYSTYRRKWRISAVQIILLFVALSKNATIILSLALSGLVTIQLIDYKHDILSDNSAMDITPYSYALMTYFVAALICFVIMYIIRENVLESHGLFTLKSYNKWIKL